MRSSGLRKALLVWALLASALAATTSTAQAGWTSNGPLTGLTATAGASTFSIQAAGGTVGVACTSSTLTGGNLAGPTGPASGSWDALTNLTLGFSGCTAAGLAANVTCTAGGTAKVKVTSYTSGTDVAAGVMANITCVIKPASFPGCTITIVASGSLGAGLLVEVKNVIAMLAILSAGQTLSATWSNCPFISPSSGSASVTFGALSYWFVSSTKPWLRHH